MNKQMNKQKFQLGNYIVVSKGKYKGTTGYITNIWSVNSRKLYQVALYIKINNKITKENFWSYELDIYNGNGFDNITYNKMLN